MAGFSASMWTKNSSARLRALNSPARRVARTCSIVEGLVIAISGGMDKASTLAINHFGDTEKGAVRIRRGGHHARPIERWHNLVIPPCCGKVRRASQDFANLGHRGNGRCI